MILQKHSYRPQNQAYQLLRFATHRSSRPHGQAGPVRRGLDPFWGLWHPGGVV